jgi:hypothetical protein
MKSVYHYRQERHFAKPPAAIWPFVSDSARIVELAGMAPYRFEERVRPGAAAAESEALGGPEYRAPKESRGSD